ncbi:ADP-ribose pyrophosphatase, mitochondrial-like [Liolophura sinensis]|uniref:ADP-ribose pyrophosphatase, mitochondrial-like n=1 Tax=Liolophura sinensis TaxID=3198878 RepID=UPI00315840B3
MERRNFFSDIVRLVRNYFGSQTMPVGHWKCRNTEYPRSDGVFRFKVPDDKVLWTTPFIEYRPVEYTAPSVKSQPPWADPELRVPNPPTLKWNAIDGKVNRKSHMGRYEIHDNVPRNPQGRTGIIGRGLLGKWGPNHAADPIVTRWKRTANGDIAADREGKNVLQIVVVQRRDTHEWALPGGMVDIGEHISVTCKREFSEEALNSLQADPVEKKKIEQSVAALFHGGKEIYRGYVDDPRNTDNAWMETVAYNFHDADGTSVGKFKLNAGDDAMGVNWMDVSRNLKLYASHNDFVRQVARSHSASW